MIYSDEQMLTATQLAYYNFSDRYIKEYYNEIITNI